MILKCLSTVYVPRAVLLGPKVLWLQTFSWTSLMGTYRDSPLCQGFEVIVSIHFPSRSGETADSCPPPWDWLSRSDMWNLHFKEAYPSGHSMNIYGTPTLHQSLCSVPGQYLRIQQARLLPECHLLTRRDRVTGQSNLWSCIFCQKLFVSFSAAPCLILYSLVFKLLH